MKKYLTAIIFAVSIITSFQKIAYADLINPEYYSKKCATGEIEVHCSYKSKGLFGPKTYDECIKYQSNPDYKFLTGEGHSFGGDSKYCYKTTSIENHIVFHAKSLLPLIFLTLLLEIPLFMLIISKTRKGLLSVIFANLISIPLLYIATLILPFSGLLLVAKMELAVVIFEALFIKLMFRDIKFRKILVYSVIANTVSVVLGTVLMLTFNALLNNAEYIFPVSYLF